MEPPRSLNAVLEALNNKSALAIAKATGAVFPRTSLMVAFRATDAAPGGQYQPPMVAEPDELWQAWEILGSLKKKAFEPLSM